MKIINLLLIVVAIVAISALSCAKEAAPSPTPTPSPSPSTTVPKTTVAPAPSPTIAPTPKPPPAPTPTGVLRFAAEALSNEGLDPMLSPTGIRPYASILYDYLVGIDDNSELDPKRSVAEKWDLSADHAIYTFQIRKGIKFHNGDDLTAEDVKFSLDRVKSEASQASHAAILRNVIKSIEVIDPYTVRITCKTPYQWLLYDLASLTGGEGAIVSKRYVESVGANYAATHPIGSGPYKFVEQKKGASLKLEAIDKHWLIGVPKYKNVEFYIVPEEITRVAMLARGDVDIIKISSAKSGEVEKLGYKVYTNTGSVGLFLYMTEQWLPGNPLGDTRVREALNLAVDREAIKNFIFQGRMKITASYLQELSLGYQPQPLYPYDKEKAKALLREAGYGAGLDLKIYSYPRAEAPELPRMLQAIAGMWQEIGVKASLISTDYASARTQWADKKFGPGVIAPLAVGSKLLPHGQLQVIASKGLLTTVKDPQFDDLIEKLVNAGSADEYAQMIGKIQAYERGNHLFIPIGETGDNFASSKEIDWKFTKDTSGWGTDYLVTRR